MRFTQPILLLLTIQTTAQAFTFTNTRYKLKESFLKSVATDKDNKNDIPDFSSFAEKIPEDDLTNEVFQTDTTNNNVANTWQESLETFLNPQTSLAEKQILLNDLVSANAEIRNSVEEALSSRKIDPILTPSAKKLQDGTRAVARQITTDILPSLTDIVASNQSNIANDLPNLVPKIGERVLDAVRTNARKNFEQLQGDLADPTRIPERLTSQQKLIESEIRNIFLETPEGLEEPNYRVIEVGEGYEIREYEGYSACATSMSKVGENFSSLNDLTSGGAAFNALAAYIFGANEEEKTMQMTTPVATTFDGEMRFYINDNNTDNIPKPLAIEDKLNEKGAVKIIDVPPARLAVARFTGFVTDGEISRQKDALLSALSIDGVEIDVPHGAVVPYIVFQYNPPYTLPIVRRNEIAIPVVASSSSKDDDVNLKKEWKIDDDDDLDDNSADVDNDVGESTSVDSSE